MKTLYHKNTWEFEYTIKDFNNNPIDLTTWKISAIIIDDVQTAIIKKNTLAGGNNSQIEILPEKNKIYILYSVEDTTKFKIGNVQLEIKIESLENKSYTVVRETFNLLPSLFT